MLFDESTKPLQVTHLVHRGAESRKIGHKLGKVTAGPCQAPQRDLCPIIAKFTFDQLEKCMPAFARQRWTEAAVFLNEGSRLPENPGIAQTAPADGDAVGAGLVQEAKRVLGLAHAAAAQHR